MNVSNRGPKMVISRRELFDVLRINHYDFDKGNIVLFEYIVRKYQLKDISDNQKQDVLSRLKNLVKVLKRYWNQSHRSYEKFLTKHTIYLNGTFDFINESASSHCLMPRGRPEKLFKHASKLTQKRKIAKVVKERSLDELLCATEVKLRYSGKRDAAAIVKGLLSSPQRGTKLKKSYIKSTANEHPVTYTPDEALSLIVSSQLTKHQYIMLRKSAKDKNVNLYPSYDAVLNSKKSCYPPVLEVTDTKAETNLQSNVDLTIKRFVTAEHNNLSHDLSNKKCDQLHFTFKWGCDGCGGLNRYKQRGSGEVYVNDSAVLATSYVPIELYSVDEHGNKILFWNNPRTSSTRFCRPVRFRFIKESPEEINNEIAFIKEQIKLLRPTQVEISGKIIEVVPQFLLTMIDGKVCNALSSNTNTQKCYICGATSKSMNKLDTQEKCNEEAMTWGISPLHAYIRFLECILHLAYKLEIKKWRAISPEEKISVKYRKKYVIDEFRNRTGLLLDTPKQGGGNTNDGNSARRFFADPEVTSSITGVDKLLIERFGCILKVLACGCKVNLTEFRKYTYETAQMYINLYNWYPMPVTVHKVLIHGADVASKFLIPLGQLSEDVIEMRHKEFKKLREGYSRKNSRVNTNLDVIHHLLVSSDPVITSLRPLPQPKDAGKLPKNVLALLEGNYGTNRDESSEEDDSGDENVEDNSLDFAMGDLSL